MSTEEAKALLAEAKLNQFNAKVLRTEAFKTLYAAQDLLARAEDRMTRWYEIFFLGIFLGAAFFYFILLVFQ